VYGGSTPSYFVVKESAKRFRMGQESLEDNVSGRPVEMIMDDNIALVEELVPWCLPHQKIIVTLFCLLDSQTG
jgi:hypothetical protein